MRSFVLVAFLGWFIAVPDARSYGLACEDFSRLLLKTAQYLHGPADLSLQDAFSQAVTNDLAHLPAPEILRECLLNEEPTLRKNVLLSLQALFERIGTHEDSAHWVDRSGLRAVLDRIGLSALPSAERAALSAELNARNLYWDALERRLVNVMQQRRNLETVTRRVTLRLFAYNALITASLLGSAVYNEVIPEKYCTPTGVLMLCGAVVGQSIGVAKLAWPRLKDRLLRVLAPRQFEALINALQEVAELNPEQGLPYLLELAKIHDQPARPALDPFGSISERAAREALLRTTSRKTSTALINLALAYLEAGYLDAGSYILDVVLKRQEGGEAAELAKRVKIALEKKQGFQSELNRLKHTRVASRVLGTAATVAAGSLTISYFRVDPKWVAALQSAVLSVASAIGVGRLVAHVWFRYPEAELREKLGRQIEDLHQSFNEIVAICPELALSFLKGIASPDNVTHPFIREAALLAILDSSHPSVASILEDIAQANVRVRGNLQFTERVLHHAIEEHRRCNLRLASMGLSVSLSR